MEERVKTNYDHPSSMDHSLLFQHLQMLKSGQPIELPVYSYVEHTRMPETIHIEPKKVIILEGILLLTDAPAQRAQLLHFRRHPAGYLPDAPHQARR
jgi:uridine kinase